MMHRCLPQALLVGGLLLVAVGVAGCAPAAESSVPGEPGGEAGIVDPLPDLLGRPAPDQDGRDEVLDLVRDAAEAIRDGRPAEAIPLYDSVAALAPTLHDWIPLLQAEAAAEDGDTHLTNELVQRIPPGTGLVERWGWRATVRAHVVAEDEVGAAAEAARWARSLEDAREAAWAWSRAARHLLATEDSSGAREAALAALAVEPGSAGGNAAARLLDDLPDLSSSESLDVGRALLRHDQGERAWERLSDRVRDGDGLAPGEGERLRLDLARALVRTDRPDRALELLAPLLDQEGAGGDPPEAEVAVGALYWYARALLAEGRESDGARVLRQVADRHPTRSEAGRALLFLAERSLEDGDEEAGRRYLERMSAGGHGTARSDLLAVRIGTSRYLEGDWRTAAEVFDGYGGPDPPHRFLYWRALALERDGDPESAREALRRVRDDSPLGFYGMAAGERLGLPLLPEGLEAGPPARSDLDTEIRNALLRLQMHRFVPTAGSLAFETDRLGRYFEALGQAADYDFAEALIQDGLSIQGIVLGREIHRREGRWNLRLLRIVYPFPFRDAIVREAHRRELDPFFVAGLIRQESMFREDIRSPAGAVGLMQIMPATGREVARGEGISNLPTSRLADPELNLRLGTAFFRELLDRFDGRVTDALAAYNAGPTRARRWRGLEEYRDVDVFVEHIPFQETRNYVRIVQQNTRIYTALYGCGEWDPCPGLSYAEWVDQTRPWVRPPAGMPAR